MTVVALRRAGCYKYCSYSSSFAKTKISFATCFRTFGAHFRQTSRSADLTDNTAVTLLNEVPEDSRVVHYHITDYVGATATANRSTVLPCSALRNSVSPACGVHTIFAVNLCGRGQFAIDLLAHLGFKRMVSCSFPDKRMRLKTRAYGIMEQWVYVH